VLLVARTLHAYLNAERMPALADLQAAIKRLGFKLTLDEAYAPFETNGYLPCTVEGEDAGVDMRFDRDASLPDTAQALAAEQGSRRAVMRLRWSGDAREHLSALIIAVALAQDFDALLIDPDKGTQAVPATLLKQARSLQEESF
jgi:hypothetical protein